MDGFFFFFSSSLTSLPFIPEWLRKIVTLFVGPLPSLSVGSKDVDLSRKVDPLYFHFPQSDPDCI